MDEPHIQPQVVVLGGPNGAGKTTASRTLLAETMRVNYFVNADVIAQGLSGFDPGAVAIRAGRIMLDRLKELMAEKQSFAFETTLSAKTYANLISQCKADGYLFHLFYVWLKSPELAIQRVAERVRKNGHFIDDETVRRRYWRGIENLNRVYLPLADSWRIVDNSLDSPVIVAELDERGIAVHRPDAFAAICGESTL